MTAFTRHISDPDRSLAQQMSARSIPLGARVGLASLAAGLLLWPLGFLVAEAASTSAWSSGLVWAAWFSTWQSALAATIGVGLSVPIGWALARLAVPARRLVRALLTLPIAIPALSVALGSSWLLDDRWPALLFANIGLALAVGVRLGGSAWLTLDPRESETARTLGLDSLQLLRGHYLPALARSYGAVWALACALAVSTFGSVHLLAPASRSALVELAGATTAGDIAPEATAAALLLAAIVAAALAVYLYCRPGPAEVGGDVGFQPLGEIAPRERLLLAAAFAVAAVVVLGPIVALIHGALTIGAAEQVTGGNLAAIIADTRPFEVETAHALRRSLVLGIGALLIAMPLGLVIASLVAPLRGWVSALIETALLLPLFLSVVLASGLRIAGLDSSWLLFVHLAIALPIVIRMVLPGARARARIEADAATVLGASPWSSWNRLVARSLPARLAVAGVLALTWSIGEVGAALLLHRADDAPLSVAIVRSLELQTDVADGRAFGLAALLVLFVTILFVTIEYRRSREITEF